MLRDHAPWFSEILIKIIDAPAVHDMPIGFRHHNFGRNCSAGSLHEFMLHTMDGVELDEIVILLVRCDLGRGHVRIHIHECKLRLRAIAVNNALNLGRELVRHRAIVRDEK